MYVWTFGLHRQLCGTAQHVCMLLTLLLSCLWVLNWILDSPTPTYAMISIPHQVKGASTSVPQPACSTPSLPPLPQTPKHQAHIATQPQRQRTAAQTSVSSSISAYNFPSSHRQGLFFAGAQYLGVGTVEKFWGILSTVRYRPKRAAQTCLTKFHVGRRKGKYGQGGKEGSRPLN